MQYEVEVNGKVRQVTVNRRDGRFVVALGERTWAVDAARIGGHTLSLLMEREVRLTPDTSTETSDARERGVQSGSSRTAAVESHELSIARNPVTGEFVFGIGTLPLTVGLNTRRRVGRKDDAGTGGAGPQRIVAPMPGKVVRVLGKPGDAVGQRQPVVVIEAMKMENELRASRDGIVTEVLVREGQSVEAGMVLAIITPS